MSWSRCSGRVAVHLQTRAGHEVPSPITRHRAGPLSHALPLSASCSLQHHISDEESSGRPKPPCLENIRQHKRVLGLGSRWRSIIRQSLATRSPVCDVGIQAHSCSHGRGYSTQAEGRTVKGPTFMETFAGNGGFAVAATKIGYTCVYANENNAHCVETYEKNHCRGGGPGISNVDRRDIKEVTLKLSHPSCMLPAADILFGGFPCPSFSNQGKQEGLEDEKNGDLFFEIMKMLIHLRNRWVVLENVKNFATNKTFEGIKMMRKEFEAVGYHMSFHVYNAVDFNLAQHRQRCFIVAIRKDLASVPFQFKTPPERRKDLALTDVLDPPSAIENPDQYTESDRGVMVPKWFIKGKEAELKWSPGTVEERTSVNGLIKVGRWEYEGQNEPFNSGRTVYHHSGFAACITTREGDWYQVPGPDGRDYIRRLSLGEMMRLQGLPEDLELSPIRTQALRQVGNSVPPPIVEWILRSLQEQSPPLPSSEMPYSTEVWPHVQSPNRSPAETEWIRKQLENLDQRKSHGKERREDEKARREDEKALREGNGALDASDSESVKTGRATGSGKSDATRTKRLNELGERIKALEKGIASLKMEHKLLAKAQSGRK